MKKMSFKNNIGSFFIFFCLFMNVCEFASASASVSASAGDDLIQQVFCNLILVIGGTIAQVVGIVIIIVTGYLFLIGKVQMTLLFVIIGGTIMVFGAPTIMSWMTGADAITCVTTDIIVGGGDASAIRPLDA